MLILASSSPRRQEILKKYGYKFTVSPADCEEKTENGLSPEQVAESLAVQKAQWVSEKYPNDTVVGADTIVVNGSEILGKPKDKAHCKEMLSALSGVTHEVITGVAVICRGETDVFHSKTSVSFYNLTEEEIDDYIATGEPADKAGGYGIQGLGALLVKEIKGDYLNVVGLPMAELNRRLKAKSNI